MQTNSTFPAKGHHRPFCLVPPIDNGFHFDVFLFIQQLDLNLNCPCKTCHYVVYVKLKFCHLFSPNFSSKVLWFWAKFRAQSPLVGQYAKCSNFKLYLIICKCELVDWLLPVCFTLPLPWRHLQTDSFAKRCSETLRKNLDPGLILCPTLLLYLTLDKKKINKKMNGCWNHVNAVWLHPWQAGARHVKLLKVAFIIFNNEYYDKC